MAQRGQGTYPGHTGGVRAGNKQKTTGPEHLCIAGLCQLPRMWCVSGGLCSRAGRVEGECPGQEDPVVGACPLGQVALEEQSAE